MVIQAVTCNHAAQWGPSKLTHHQPMDLVTRKRHISGYQCHASPLAEQVVPVEGATGLHAVVAELLESDVLDYSFRTNCRNEKLGVSVDTVLLQSQQYRRCDSPKFGQDDGVLQLLLNQDEKTKKHQDQSNYLKKIQDVDCLEKGLEMPLEVLDTSVQTQPEVSIQNESIMDNASSTLNHSVEICHNEDVVAKGSLKYSATKVKSKDDQQELQISDNSDRNKYVKGLQVSSVLQVRDELHDKQIGKNKTTRNQEMDQRELDDNKEESLIIVESDSSGLCEADGVIHDSLVSEHGTEDPMTADDDEIQDTDENTQDHIPRNRSRAESQKKMEEGKFWLVENLMMIGSAVSVIKLTDIEKSYLTYCQHHNQEPLATHVLARVIHKLFPDAGKCRLGPRGNQRIHYRNLKFKFGASNTSLQHLDSAKTTEEQNVDGNKNQINLADNGKHDPQVKVESQKYQVKIEGKEFIMQQQKSKQSGPCDKVLKQKAYSDEEKDVPLLLDAEQQQSTLSHEDAEEECKNAAKKLSEVLKWITSQSDGHRKTLLRDFAHSASCQKPNCLPVCLMFRRVRRHVVAAQHDCSVLRLYSVLLRHHVSSCKQTNCGLPACPALQLTRDKKRSLVQDARPSKRVAVMCRPSSLPFGLRSPGGSLPGSPVNSPPTSPFSTFQQIPSMPKGMGQVQYVMLPMMMMPFVENHGA